MRSGPKATHKTARVLAVLRDGPTGPAEGDRGSALVEYIASTLLLLVPLIYLILTLAQVQAGVFAAQGSARDAGRLIATGTGPVDTELATAGVELAFADHGIQIDGAEALAIECAEPSCPPGSQALVTVSASVPLPFVPSGLTSRASITVSAQAWTTIDPYRDRR